MHDCIKNSPQHSAAKAASGIFQQGIYSTSCAMALTKA